MIMAVLFAVPFFPLVFCREFSWPAKSVGAKQKTHSVASGSEFLFAAVLTNSPLAPYLGGTQNRNQYA
jgi:hypothetical protein